MKKIISLISTLAMVLGMVNISVSAGDTLLYSTTSQTVIAKGANKTLSFGGNAYKQDITIEAEYTIGDDTHWTNDCNIPFIILSNSTELGRVSVYSNDSDVLNTRGEKQPYQAITSPSVYRSGTFIVEVDYTNSELHFKYNTAKNPDKSTLFDMPFNYNASNGITGIKIGASGNPGITINSVKVYDGIGDNAYVNSFAVVDSAKLSGGSIVNSAYGRDDYCYKSNNTEYGNITISFPQVSTGFASVEFDLLMDTNTSFSSVSILNKLNKPVTRLYFENEEKIAYMTYDNDAANNLALGHIITTWNKQWVRVRADVDITNQNAMWYINNRPLQTKPVNLTREYVADNAGVSGNDIIYAIQIGCRKGVYVYADNVRVYTAKRNEAIAPTSSEYDVDTTYSMITGVPFGTKVSTFLKNISPANAKVISRSVKDRSNDEIIQPGDTVRINDGTNTKDFAIGLEGEEVSSVLYENTTEIYVSPTGNDLSDGKLNTPFKTIEKAIETAKQTQNNVIIYLRKGIYNISETIEISNCKNLTIRAYGNEEAVLVGGKLLTFTKAEQSKLQRLDESVRDKIVEADISGIDIGEFTQAGWDLPFRQSKAVLTRNGKTQTLARYPNDGYLTSGSISQTNSFTYSEAEPDNWQFNNDIYVWGFFGCNYGGYDVNVSSISTADNIVTVSGEMYGSAKNSFEYYFFNVFEELDTPGEYYIDEENEVLYYYPEDGYEDQRMILGSTNSTLLRIQECDNVSIEGINFEGGRENAIEMNNCINTVIRDCEIKGFGMNGIEIVGGLQCGAEYCELSYIGADAVKLSAGDMYTLTPSKHFVRNCNIHNFSERKKSYTSAVTMSGDGFEVSGNVIHSSPHMGLYLRATNVDIFNNNFYDLVQNAKDAGAIYSVDTCTRRGILIHDNVFDNIKNKYDQECCADVKCIYLDNYTSGWKVYNNIFKNSDEGIHMNGGRENEFYNNVFINLNSAMNIQDINMYNFAAAPYYQIDYYPISSSLWKSHFPNVDNFITSDKGHPQNTRVADNVMSNVGRTKVDVNKYVKFVDHKTISTADVTEDGSITNYTQYINKIAPVEPGTQRGFIIGETSPMSSVAYIEKGECENAYYFDGVEMQIPDQIVSSNETQVSVKGNLIYAIGDSGAYITLSYQGEKKQIYVATNQYRLSK